MALYLARHPDLYTGGIVSLVPPRAARSPPRILHDLGATLRAWVVGQISPCSSSACSRRSGSGSSACPYFLAFGVFAGVAAIVPFFGTLVSTILPALFALSVAGVLKALLVRTRRPGPRDRGQPGRARVMERQVNLPPVLTIAGVLIMGRLFGLGPLVAVPIIAVIMVLVRHVLLGEVYGDPARAAQRGPCRPTPRDRRFDHLRTPGR